MQAHITLHLSARLEDRHAAESELRSLCHAGGHPAIVADEVVSAFNEAFNNVVLHAYRDRQDGQVRVTLDLDGDTLVIELSDSGLGFDLSAIPPPNPDRLAEGGYGLHIIRSLMSEVLYYKDGPSNILRMTRQLEKNPR